MKRLSRKRVTLQRRTKEWCSISHNHRRVIALLGLDDEAFNISPASAWDDLIDLFAERHAVAESQSLALYKLSTAIGEAIVDPASTDVYVFERTLRRLSSDVPFGE